MIYGLKRNSKDGSLYVLKEELERGFYNNNNNYAIVQRKKENLYVGLERK